MIQKIFMPIITISFFHFCVTGIDYCLPSFPQETGKDKINTIVFYISHQSPKD